MAAKKKSAASSATSASGAVTVPNYDNYTTLGIPWAPDPALKMPDPNVPMPALDEAGDRETRRAHGLGYSDYV